MSLKRKADSATVFTAAEGKVNFLHFQRAVEEFERDHDSEGKKLLLACNVHLKKWLNSGINERMGHVFVEAIFKNGDVFTESNFPRVLFEVEFEHRSVAQAHAFVLQYFPLIPVLQAAVLFVFWGKRNDGSFAAIAILYRRNGAVGTARDAVSFGSADIFPGALRHIPACIRALPIRNLPNAPVAIPVHAPNPWNAAHQAFIRVPGVDLFHLGPAGALIAGAPDPPPDFDIDLWTIYKKVKGNEF